MKYRAALFILFILILAGQSAPAYEAGPAWVTVIESGKVLFYERLEDAEKSRSAQYPYLKKLDLSGKFIRFDVTLSNGHYVPVKCAAPETYKGRKILACPLRYFTRSGRRLVFLSYGIHPLEGKGGVKEDDYKGVFAVVDEKTGAIRTVVPGEYTVHGAGRGSLMIEPQLGLADGCAFFERNDCIVAFDLDSGRERWQAHERFGWSEAFISARMAGNALIVRTKDGIARLDRDTGRCIWRTDKVMNMILLVDLGPDNRLYVVSWDAP